MGSSFIDNESGNVLLFTIVCMLFLVFVSTMLSVSIANRVSLVRKISDSNQLITQAEQRNAFIENGITELLNQNDELARYYVSQRFYENHDTNFSGTSAVLDGYLKNVIQPLFQAEVKTRNLVNVSDMDQLTNIVFVYLTVMRVNSAPVGASALQSYSEKINKIDTDDVLLSTSNIRTSSAYINTSNPGYDEIVSVINASNELLSLEFNVAYKTSSSKNLLEIKTHFKYQMLPYKYKLNGDNVVQPTSNSLKKDVLHNSQYIIEAVPRT